MIWNKVIKETGIHVWKDGVWVKPYHVTVSSLGCGTAHWFFWRRKPAIALAEWVAQIVSDSHKAIELDGEGLRR